MPRLIDTAILDGSQLDVTASGTRLTIWEKGPDGGRYARELEGDEALEAVLEIKEWLVGERDEDEMASDAKPSRIARTKKGAG